MKYQKVCILGAAGSIGSRLVALLNDQGYQVTAVVRSLSSAVRIGRLGVTIVSHDMLTISKDELSETMSGHDVVIDCTYSTNPDYDERISEAKKMANLICDMAQKANVGRLIHYGTISVYPTNSSEVNESVVCDMSGDSYGDSKLVAERIFLERNSNDFRVTVLQLPIVFGPYMGWSHTPVVHMSGQCLVMPDDISGMCSPLFVDDVIYATVLAFDCTASHGQRILLSDKSLSWADYYKSYSLLTESLNLAFVNRETFDQKQKSELFSELPFQRLKKQFMDDGDFRQLILAQWGIRNIYSLIKRRRGQGGVDKIKDKITSSLTNSLQPEQVLLPKHTLTLFDSLSEVKSNKAKEILNFEPQVNFSEAILITKEWLQWARLIK